jgi:hypothetical protein
VSGWTSTRYTDNFSTVCLQKHSARRSSPVSYQIQRLCLLSVCHPTFAQPLGSTSLASPRTVRWTHSTPSGSGRGRPVGVIDDTEGPDQKVTLRAWLAARAHLVLPPTIRDSNGDSNRAESHSCPATTAYARACARSSLWPPLLASLNHVVLAAEVKGASRPTDSLRSPLTSAPKTKSGWPSGRLREWSHRPTVLSGGVVKEFDAALQLAPDPA